MIGFKHPVTQRLRRLVRKRSERDAEGVFVVEGPKLLTEALAAGALIEAVFVSAGFTSPEVDQLRRSGVDVYELAPADLERVADTVTPQPVLAIVQRQGHTLSVIEHATSVLVLADVRDPGNAGTVLRSAEAAGIDVVVFGAGSVDPYNPKTVRSTAGAVFHVPVVTDVELSDALTALEAASFVTVGTTMVGGTVYDQCDLTRKVAIVMGNEANGLSAEDQLALHEMVSIPIEGRSESLNVSMAASILVFDLARQRRASAAQQA